MPKTLTPFTERMYKLCDIAPDRCKDKAGHKYKPKYFRDMLDECDGDFAPVAKKLLRGKLNDGLITLAKGKALEISMEWAILNEREWDSIFNDEDRELAKRRLEAAEMLAR